MTKVITYDTTLRDGAQREGISLSIEDKIRIAKRLDEFGVDYIEGGFLGSNPKDTAFYSAFARGKLVLKNAQLVAFGLPARKGLKPDEDPALKMLANCAVPVITLVAKASERQVEQALRMSGEENLRMIFESIKYLVQAGKRVFFDAEHFFDGYLENTQYAYEVLVAALEAGAEYIVLADTNGGMLPHQISAIIQETIFALRTLDENVSFGIHAHDDSGCAVANSLLAVMCGVSMVQGTINGCGERVGNANLLTIIANLELKLGYETVGPAQLTQLTSLSRFVADTMNMAQDPFAPYVGENAFTHKGGMHVSAETRMTDAYQHIDPAKVGNFSHVVMSELAGRAALRVKAQELGISVPDLTDD
ncbi:MAG: citramalate synthase, partial [Coriobacteriia bacterium]|nr:citramalate synthase [Coriobacteriia bacterium]